MLPIGLENLHCSLIIQRDATEHSENVFKQNLLKYLPDDFVTTENSGYSITNIAGYIPSLPVNSIFKNISFYPSNWPDFSKLPINGPITTTNSSDISQNPQTRKQAVSMYSENDIRAEPHQTARNEQFDEASLERRKKKLTTFPTTGSNGDDVDYKTKLQKLNLLTPDQHVDYDKFIELSGWIWPKHTTVENDDVLGSETEALSVLQKTLESNEIDVWNHGNSTRLIIWTPEIAIVDLITHMNIGKIMKTVMLTKRNLESFVKTVITLFRHEL